MSDQIAKDVMMPWEYYGIICLQLSIFVLC